MPRHFLLVSLCPGLFMLCLCNLFFIIFITVNFTISLKQAHYFENILEYALLLLGDNVDEERISFRQKTGHF